MLENSIKIRWYSTIESTDSTKNILGPHIKFKLNANCTTNNKDRKIGARTVEALGMRKISLESILKRSANIWNAPFLPIRVGPIRRWAKARSFLSVKTINSTVRTQVNDSINANS